MYKATLYFSDKDKDTRDAALARVVELGLDVGLEGATTAKTIGVWKDTTEPGFTYTVLGPHHGILELKIEQVAVYLGHEYDQKSVLIEIG